MNIKELKATLDQFPPNLPVRFIESHIDYEEGITFNLIDAFRFTKPREKHDAVLIVGRFERHKDYEEEN